MMTIERKDPATSVSYSLTKDSLARALPKWQDEYIANPEDFTIYKEGESQEYGVAAANALLDYVNQVDGEIKVYITGETQ